MACVEFPYLSLRWQLATGLHAVANANAVSLIHLIAHMRSPIVPKSLALTPYKGRIISPSTAICRMISHGFHPPPTPSPSCHILLLTLIGTGPSRCLGHQSGPGSCNPGPLGLGLRQGLGLPLGSGLWLGSALFTATVRVRVSSRVRGRNSIRVRVRVISRAWGSFFPYSHGRVVRHAS